jgi:diguanylate cyclase (GGDEF)-like protein
MNAAQLSEKQFEFLLARWRAYCNVGTFERYVGFALALNSFTEHASRLRLPGLIRLCTQLEHMVITLYGDESTHPLDQSHVATVQAELDVLSKAVENLSEGPTVIASKVAEDLPADYANQVPQRVVWVIADAAYQWVGGLTEQFTFFGFTVIRRDWANLTDCSGAPLAMLLIPPETGYGLEQIASLTKLRQRFAASQLFCLRVPKSLPAMVELLRAGADVTILPDEDMSTVLARVLELVQPRDDTPARVLVVEDSPTALVFIRRALAAHGITSHAIKDPHELIHAIEMYQPDLVLMDMHMPNCSGIEANRVMRQLAAYHSLPVVYHSSETELNMQIEALRLGGDQFLSKPCNPLLLAAVVRTKIERYREMQRSTLQDSPTGLLNHTAAKTRLSQLISASSALGNTPSDFCVAMIDIDHFKKVNGTHGHPVGDQVIRSLAWLLKGRLRATDIVCRYGGEEFLVVLRNTDAAAAFEVLERIREDFASMPHGNAGSAIRATFSSGVAQWQGGEAVAQLTKRADDALLLAKRAGRNQILTA